MAPWASKRELLPVCVRVTRHLRETVGNPAKAANGAICREEIHRPGLEYKVIITVVNF